MHVHCILDFVEFNFFIVGNRLPTETGRVNSQLRFVPGLRTANVDRSVHIHIQYHEWVGGIIDFFFEVLLKSFLAVDSIKNQYKTRLVKMVLNGYLSLRR